MVGSWIVFVASAAVIVYAGTKLSHYGDQIADLFSCRSLESSMFRIGVFSNRWIVAGLLAMVGLQLLLTYVPVMNRLFHTAPIDGLAWAPILATGLAVYAVVGIEKWIRLRFTATLSVDRWHGEGA